MRFLSAFCRAIDAVNETVGSLVAWLTGIMVVVQFVVVIMRYGFGMGSIMTQESIVYMFAIVFLAASGFALKHDAHVRIDIFYRGASRRRKAWIDLIGAIVFALPFCVLVWIKSYPMVAISWRVFEGSINPSGLPYVYILKGFILVFAALLFLQSVALGLRAAMVLAGRTNGNSPAA
ncbi:MAG: TRAP transporter small permease subunit [Alphaproteobacteria bacterium]|nr:TRAP transporter small permease subunit [Alphaproteobacteria bacterium]